MNLNSDFLCGQRNFSLGGKFIGMLIGPGAYNQVGLGQDSMKKAYIESTRRGVFGTTSARINAMVKKDDYQLPGPAHYTVKESSKINEPKHKQPMGVFSSLSNRVHEDVEAKVSCSSNIKIWSCLFSV